MQNVDGITTYPRGSDIASTIHLNGIKIPNSFQQLEPIYKEFIKNNKLG